MGSHNRRRHQSREPRKRHLPHISPVTMTITGLENLQTYDSVQDYYGKVLAKSSDLKTNACCTSDAPPVSLRPLFGKLHSEVLERYYGCGLVFPEVLEGMSVLDLGCGAGRDCYLMSQLVGEKGRVVGVDMTEEQLECAERHQAYHVKSFGYEKSNVEFKKGYIERLDELGLADASFDIVISNCVVNLSPEKERVLAEVFRVLKPGGEMYFSDVYSSRRVPEALVKDEVLFGECLSGALYWNDFENLAKKVGSGAPRLVKDSKITIESPDIERLIGHIDFFSATYRLWKLEGLESDCEDYGQAVIYKGTIPDCPHYFELDGHHKIETGKVFPVCGNTWRMMADTRLAAHFDFIGDFSVHYGIFDGCGKGVPYA